jgi:hypothetical protein
MPKNRINQVLLYLRIAHLSSYLDVLLKKKRYDRVKKRVVFSLGRDYDKTNRQ